jgi:hypothetical protein
MPKNVISEEAEALCRITEGLEKRLDSHESFIGRDGAELRSLMSEAVAEGFRRAVSDPDVWNAAATAMQRHVQQQAGGLVLGGLRTVISKLALLAMAAWAIYSLGGLNALLAWAKAGATP